MDAVFGTSKNNAIENTWEWLCEKSDRFTKAYTITGKSDIEGLRKIDAIEKIDRLANEDDAPFYENIDCIGYWDRENEKIWVLPPVKMALLLHKYEEAKKLLEKGYTFEELYVNGYVYISNDFDVSECHIYGKEFPPEYDSRNPSSAKGIKTYERRAISGLDFIYADENIPTDLICALINEYKMTHGSFDVDSSINVNAITERINPKWVIKVCEESLSKELFDALASYAFSRFPSFIFDNTNTYDAYGQVVSWGKHIYNFKVRLQLQLDIAKMMVENKQIEKLKRAIIRDNIFAINFIEVSEFKDTYYRCNKKYTIEQLNNLIKQRKKLIEVCQNNKSLYKTLCLKVISEVVSLRVNLIDCNANNNEENEAKYVEISNAIDKYEQMILTYFSKEWKDSELQTSMQSILKELNTIQGMRFIDAVCEYRNKNLEFVTNKDTMDVMNKWLEYGVSLVFMANAPANNQTGIAFCFGSSGEEVNDYDVHKDLAKISKSLSKITWKVKEPGIVDGDNRKNTDFYENVSKVNDENIYRTLHKTGLLAGKTIEVLIGKLLEKESLENVPYLIALKSIK